MINIDLIRDVMLYLEENYKCYTDKKDIFRYELNLDPKEIYCDKNLSSKYTVDDIKRCILELSDAGLINCVGNNNANFFFVHSLTNIGHKFVDIIATDDIWNEIKSRACALDDVSIPIIIDLSVKICNHRSRGVFKVELY